MIACRRLWAGWCLLLVAFFAAFHLLPKACILCSGEGWFTDLGAAILAVLLLAPSCLALLVATTVVAVKARRRPGTGFVRAWLSACGVVEDLEGPPIVRKRGVVLFAVAALVIARIAFEFS